MKKLLIILLIFVSCEKEQETYIVFKENSHYSNIGVQRQDSNELHYIVEFNESIVYDIGTDQSDKCKLFGLAPGFQFNWDELSFRHSFFFMNDSVHIGAYIHDNDTLIKKHLYTGLYEPIECYLKDYGDSVIFVVNNHYLSIPVTPHETKNYYIPNPYFGGNCKPPHEITIKYEEL
jgi:hypothetical protein